MIRTHFRFPWWIPTNFEWFVEVNGEKLAPLAIRKLDRRTVEVTYKEPLLATPMLRSGDVSMVTNQPRELPNAGCTGDCCAGHYVSD